MLHGLKRNKFAQGRAFDGKRNVENVGEEVGVTLRQLPGQAPIESLNGRPYSWETGGLGRRSPAYQRKTLRGGSFGEINRRFRGFPS